MINTRSKITLDSGDPTGGPRPHPDSNASGAVIPTVCICDEPQRSAGPRPVGDFDPRGTIEKALPEGWAWDERELVLLGILERQARHVEQLEAALAGMPYVVSTAKGEPKVNPLVAELRLSYAAMSRTAEAIRLPEVDGESSNKSVRHQRASRRRWDRRSNG